MSRIRSSLALVLALAAALAGCRSSAPYTAPAAILNGALAVGAAVHQRSAGGCYATCAPGMVCNSRTGYCEAAPLCGTCKPGEFCSHSDGGWRCVPPTGSPAIDLKSGASPAAAQPGVPGVSPATGRPPALPAEQRGERP